MIPDEKQPEIGQADEERAKEMEDMFNQINTLEKEEKHLDEEMKQKESLLETIKQQQKEMQDALLKEMREEYHKKISGMVDEMRRLEAEKAESLQQSTGNA